MSLENRVCLVVLTSIWFVFCSVLILVLAPGTGWVVAAFAVLILCVVKCLDNQANFDIEN